MTVLLINNTENDRLLLSSALSQTSCTLKLCFVTENKEQKYEERLSEVNFKTGLKKGDMETVFLNRLWLTALYPGLIYTEMLYA